MPEKKNIMKRIARRGRGAVGGAKGSAIQGAVGVASYALHSIAAKHSEFVSSKYWVGPIALALVGHTLNRKRPGKGYGTAMLGAAGYAMALGYQQTKATAQTQPAETGAVVQPLESVRRDVGSLIDSDYDTGMAGYLDSTMDPTSSYYARQGTVAGDDSSIADAMGL